MGFMRRAAHNDMEHCPALSPNFLVNLGFSPGTILKIINIHYRFSTTMSNSQTITFPDVTQHIYWLNAIRRMRRRERQGCEVDDTNESTFSGSSSSLSTFTWISGFSYKCVHVADFAEPCRHGSKKVESTTVV